MDILGTIKGEARTIRAAPFSFFVFVIIGVSLGYGASTWYYSKQISDRDAQIGRYRVALGIDKGSASALVELSNSELAAKAISSASSVRTLCFAFQKREALLGSATAGSKKQQDEWRKADNALMQGVSDEFDRDLKADFVNANNEVIRRLDPKSLGGVVRFPIWRDAETGAPVGMPSLMSGELEAPFLCSYADQLEQMAKLLPPDSPKP